MKWVFNKKTKKGYCNESRCLLIFKSRPLLIWKSRWLASKLISSMVSSSKHNCRTTKSEIYWRFRIANNLLNPILAQRTLIRQQLT